MQFNEDARTVEPTHAAQDLGPLAWVLDELRKVLERTGKTLRRTARELQAAQAAGTELTPIAAALQPLSQPLQQSTGALQMVGMPAVAVLMSSLEAVARQFVARPELCTAEAAATVERAGAAVVEYLETVLAGTTTPATGLFPQYREVMELGDGEKAHPADLWSFDWKWVNPGLGKSPALGYDAAVRARMDQAVLNMVKNADTESAQEIAGLSLQLAAAQTHEHPSIFWQVSAAFFEAFALGLLPTDLYVKRLASRLLMQFSTLARGDADVPAVLLRDLLFFCAQAGCRGADAPVLGRVQQAFGLLSQTPIDYEKRHFGRFDAVLLAQTRKRIQAVAETWSAVAGGDVNRMRSAVEQFQQLSDVMVQMQPESAEFARALSRVVADTQRSGRMPAPPLSMEVATSVLYLQAAYDDLDQDDARLSERLAHLTDRLQQVRSGGLPQPLEPWMEELYGRVSDRRTMGSVVTELKASLAETEKLLDQYFRDGSESGVLPPAAARLSQMRGVLSVLGLDHASQAVVQMRDSIDRLASHPGDTTEAAEKLGNNLGALGFLIDMLGYQPTLAKKLFVYDEARGELLPVMGRSVAAPVPLETATPTIEAIPMADEPMVEMPAAVETIAVIEAEAIDTELLEIFLEEVREVIGNGVNAVAVLEANSVEAVEQASLRRAFHTLKGSSRMVGLMAFGNAAWSFEQLHNSWLAEQKPADAPLLQLSRDALLGFGRWADAIAADDANAWSAAPFEASADALRLEGQLVALQLPGMESDVPAALPAVSEIEAVAPFEFEAAQDETVEPIAEAIESVEAISEPIEAVEAIEPIEPIAEPISEPLEMFEPIAAELVEPTAEPALLDLVDAIESVDFAAIEIEPVAEPAEFEMVIDSTDSQPVVAEAVEPEAEAEAEAFALADVPEQPDVVIETIEAVAAEAEPIESVESADFVEPFEAVEATEAVELIDIDTFEPVEAVLSEQEQPASQYEAEPEFMAEPDAISQYEPEPAAADADGFGGDDEAVRMIGPLRVAIPLYNVYLGEADEWSRRLLTEISEWAMQPAQPVSDTAVAMAHALGGSSSTVGFTDLAMLSRKLEKSLGHMQVIGWASAGQVQVCNEAALEIETLLLHFAAGQLKSASEPVLQALDELLETTSAAAVPAATGDTARAELAEDPIEIDALDTVETNEAVEPAELADTIEAAEATDFIEATDIDETIDAAEAAETAEVEEVEGAFDAMDTVPPLETAKAIESPLAAPAGRIETTSRAPLLELDEEIDVQDAVDPDLFPIFEEEALELLPRLSAALRQYVAEPAHPSARGEVLRVLHTLKGSARLAGALRLGELAHRMESQLEQHAHETLQSAQLEPLLGGVDLLQSHFDQVRGLAMQDEPAAVEPIASAQPVAANDAAVERGYVRPASATVAVAAQTLRLGSQSVRVRGQLLDRLVNQAGEIMMTRARLESHVSQLRDSLSDLTGNLDRLRQQLRDVELQAETQMQSRLAQSKDSGASFDPLEFDRFTRVQELTRMMAESVNDVATVQRSVQRSVEGAEDDLVAQARQSRELQRDLLRTRMVEFEGISERLYGVVRQAAKDSSKQVKLDITGGSIEMDRGMLDRLAPAFEHLLRNAVAHGIESSQARIDAGKPAAGAIAIALRQSGNEVSLSFRDDGAGLDLQRIRQKAVERELLGSDRPMTDAQAAQLIFTPGFSTASTVTELSGRGIGMDVVRAEVDALGGRIETDSKAGVGTGFTLVLPLTTAVTQVVMVRAGEQSVGIPSAVVELVRRVPAAEIDAAYASGTLAYGGEDIPFYWCGALLQASPRSVESATKTLSVLIIRSASQRLALHVDEVLGNQEVVVKNLGPQLARLPGLAGMSVLPTGAVALIYNPVALATVYGVQARQWVHARTSVEQPSADASGGLMQPAADAVQQAPLVLVVDDSITVRRVTQRLLQREGFRVALAADGLQALERLADELPVMVLSDIEMPRMDGFDLARNIRGDVRTADLPIVMITSRIGDKHREHARELGVQHYLGKPYSEEELLRLTRHYARQRVGVETL